MGWDRLGGDWTLSLLGQAESSPLSALPSLVDVLPFTCSGTGDSA